MADMPIRDVAYRVSEQLKRTTEDHQTQALMSVIDAMGEYVDKQFWFNETTGYLEIYPDQFSYARMPETPVADTGYFPADLLMPKRPWVRGYVGDPVDEKFEDLDYPLKNKTTDYTHYYRGARNRIARPWAYAFFADKMELVCNPDRRYRMRLDYVKDLGVPIYRLVGGVWTFFEPDGTTVLDTATWTNDWIKHAEPMLRFYAKYLMYANIYDDFEKAAIQERLANEEFRSLSNRSNNYDKEMLQQSGDMAGFSEASGDWW
jgi:hypothetical protein